MNVSRTSAQIRRPLAFVLAAALTFASCGGGDTVALNAEGSGAIELEPSSTSSSLNRDANNDEPDQSTTTGVSTTLTTAAAGARARTVKPCSDFAAHADAQRYFSLDPVGRVSLDPDGDGVACEDLPGAPVDATTTTESNESAAGATTTVAPTTTTVKPTTTTAAPTTTTVKPTTTTTTAAPVASDVPSVNTQSVPGGASVNLASFVRGDKPVVFWSWAPH